MKWSAPHYGVQHLGGHRALTDRVYQVTLTDRGTFVEWYILSLRGGKAFSPIKEGVSKRLDLAERDALKAFLQIVE